MSRSSSAPSLLTHREIDSLLGGGARGARQRQRLCARGLLPEPRWVYSDRQRLGIYPQIVVVGLLPGFESRRSTNKLLESILLWTRHLLGLNSFETLSSSIKKEISTADDWRYDDFILQLASDEASAYDAWTEEVIAYEHKLVHEGVSFDITVARIRNVLPDRYVVVEEDYAGMPYVLDRTAALAPFEEGCPVAIQEVRGFGVSRQFLAPCIREKREETAAADDPWSEVTDADFDRLLQKAADEASLFSYASSYWVEEDPAIEDFPISLADIDRHSIPDGRSRG